MISCGMSFGWGMKFRKPFSPNTRNIKPNRIRTITVTMCPADFSSRPCTSTVCDAVLVIGFPFNLRQLFGELFKRPTPTPLHSVMSDLSVALVFSQRVGSFIINDERLCRLRTRFRPLLRADDVNVEMRRSQHAPLAQQFCSYASLSQPRASASNSSGVVKLI